MFYFFYQAFISNPIKNSMFFFLFNHSDHDIPQSMVALTNAKALAGGDRSHKVSMHESCNHITRKLWYINQMPRSLFSFFIRIKPTILRILFSETAFRYMVSEVPKIKRKRVKMQYSYSFISLAPYESSI